MIFNFVLKNLLRSKIRTLLTIVGVSVGISAYISLTMTCDHLTKQVTKLFGKIDIDVVIMDKFATTPFKSMITESDYKQISKIDGVKEITALLTGEIKTSWSPFYVILGIGANENLLRKLKIVLGQRFRPGQKEVIIGERTAQMYGIKLYDSLELSPQHKFFVSGIYESDSKVVDGSLILDIEQARKLLKINNIFNLILIETEKGFSISHQIEKINDNNSRLKAYWSGEFFQDMLVSRVIDIFIWLVSIIASLSCIFILSNTFTTAINERTREIGILRAIGWGPFHVMALIIGESLLLSFLGALAGNLLAFLELKILLSFNSSGLGWLIPVNILPQQVLNSFLLSIIVGIISASLPALKVIKMQPSDALRFE